MVVVALLAVWGIDNLIKVSGANLFDFVYIVILTQLALIGPVVVGLMTMATSKKMWLAIVTGLIAGFGSTLIGIAAGKSYLIDGAGTFAILASLVTAYGVYCRDGGRLRNKTYYARKS